MEVVTPWMGIVLPRLSPGRGINRNPIGDKPGSGPDGDCVCPSCGYTTPHSRLNPCNQRKCPKCGVVMTRE